MPTIAEILTDFVLPALIVAVGLVLGWSSFRIHPRNGRWLGAIAIPLACAVAGIGVFGKPTLPPGTGDASYWLIWFMIPLAIFGVLDSLLPLPIWLRAGIIFLLVRIGGGVLLAPLISSTATNAASVVWSINVWLDVLALISLLWWLGWENLTAKYSGPLVPILLVLSLAGDTAVLGLANDIKLSQLLAALTVMAVVIAVASWIWPAISLSRGALLPLALLPLGCETLAHYYYYTEPPVLCVGLLLVAPMLAYVGELRPVVKIRPRWRWLIRFGPTLLLLAIAAAFSVRQFLAAQAADSGAGL